jgi:toxin-antitoxin system PIN domain toxin
VSFAIDANVLVYASAEGSPFHRRAREFLEASRTGAELVCLTWPTLMAYLRLVTHAAILSPPLSPEGAMRNVEALLDLPQVRALGELDGFWETYRACTESLAVRGNLVPDAHVAAILRQHGVRTLYTNDADFRKFAFLDVRNPFS